MVQQSKGSLKNTNILYVLRADHAHFTEDLYCVRLGLRVAPTIHLSYSSIPVDTLTLYKLPLR